MTLTSPRLSRGLQSLLASSSSVADRPAPADLPIKSIQTGPSQPRASMRREALEELAASIKANGVIQPIVVRPLGAQSPPRYEIIAGERRWQAAQIAGLNEIPAVVREASDQEAVAIALIENIQREELTPVEEGRALKRLLAEFSLTHDQLSEVVGRSRAAVTNIIRLLDLPPAALALVEARKLSMGHARALLGLEEDAEREVCAHLVVERGLSVRQTEEWVRKRRDNAGETVPKKAPDLSVIRVLHKSSTVQVQLQQKRNSSRILIDVRDAAERDRILAAVEQALQKHQDPT